MFFKSSNRTRIAQEPISESSGGSVRGRAEQRGARPAVAGPVRARRAASAAPTATTLPVSTLYIPISNLVSNPHQTTLAHRE